MTVEKIKIPGAVLELPDKQHCQTKKEQAVILHGFHDFRTCTVIGDYEDSISDLKDWSESHEGKILVTKPSIYLTGASYAVYEGIGNAEKVSTILL